MKREHLERLRPICPVCRLANRSLEPLRLGSVARSAGDDILEGVLLCPNSGCQREHPIIDGVPIVVADIRTYIADHYNSIMARDDLSPLIESMVGDCTGPGSAFDLTRSFVSSYADSHYGDGAHGVASLVGAGVQMLSKPPAGMWIDIGCSTGRASFELASRTGELVLGIDLNFAMLRLARRMTTDGEVTYSRRRGGVVYEPRRVALDLPHRDQVTLWACDAGALPFENGAFAGACSMNVLDSVASPLLHLAEMGRVVADGGEAIVCSPYDWSSGATEMTSWIGGHSQRSPNAGDSADEVRRLLSDESPEPLGIRLRLVREQDRVPWTVRMHDRSEVTYQVHLLIARSRH